MNDVTNYAAVRVHLSLPERLAERLDQIAREAGYTRSGFIAQAVREKLDKYTRDAHGVVITE